MWGEIADKLGKYDTVREYDEQLKPISDLGIIKRFFDKPTLLMIDELPHYLIETLAEKIGDTTKSKITESFLYKLISVVSSKSSKNTSFVLTLTENQQLYKERVDSIKSKIKNIKVTDYVIDDTVEGLRETASRQTVIKNPVQKEEIYDVIRHRLIRHINDNEKLETIRQYTEHYTNEGLMVDPTFQEKMKKSYPIHPELIDMLYSRVSTISKFNQTRGTLRFLALVLNDIYKNKRECTLVGTGDINLESSAIIDEVTSNIDRNEFKKIIDVDCVKHSKELDEDKHVKIVESVARTIYLHSLHETPNKKSGITVEQIKLATSKPGFDTSLVDKAVHDSIKPYFWYIQETNNQFYFIDSVNENAIIAEHKKYITKQKIDDQIYKQLESMSSGLFKPKIWNDDIEDSRMLKLCIIKYDVSDISERIYNIIEHVNHDSPRTYKNTIVCVYTDPNRVNELKSTAKELASIIKAKKDERVKVDKVFLKKIIEKESRAKGNLNSACIKAYNQIGYPDGSEPRLDVMSYGDMRSNTIGEMVREFMNSKGKLISEVGYNAINVDSYKKLEDIYEGFLRDKRQKFIERMESIKNAAREGVREGIFGYSNELVKSDQKYIGIISQDIDVQYSGYIINKNSLETIIKSQEKGLIAPPPRHNHRSHYLLNSITQSQ